MITDQSGELQYKEQCGLRVESVSGNVFSRNWINSCITLRRQDLTPVSLFQLSFTTAMMVKRIYNVGVGIVYSFVRMRMVHMVRTLIARLCRDHFVVSLITAPRFSAQAVLEEYRALGDSMTEFFGLERHLQYQYIGRGMSNEMAEPAKNNKLLSQLAITVRHG